MKQGMMTAAAIGLMALTAGQAQAEAGDLLIRARIITVAPTDGENTNGGILPALPGASVNVNEAYIPEVDITYFFTKNIAVETICCVARHTIRGARGIAALGGITKTWVLPFTANLQYHLMPEGQIRPYVGAGLNYTLFFGEKESASLKGALGNAVDVNVKNKVGFDLQAGFDVPLTGNWFLNADFKYYFLKPNAVITGGALTAPQTVRVKLNPILAGIGVGYKF
jgi:outer membrane protein